MHEVSLFLMVGLHLQPPPSRGKSPYCFLLLYLSREDLIPQFALLNKQCYPSLKLVFVDFPHYDHLRRPRTVAHMIVSFLVGLCPLLCFE
jgi:hypothetical protein